MFAIQKGVGTFAACDDVMMEGYHLIQLRRNLKDKNGLTSLLGARHIAI